MEEIPQHTSKSLNKILGNNDIYDYSISISELPLIINPLIKNINELRKEIRELKSRNIIDMYDQMTNDLNLKEPRPIFELKEKLDKEIATQQKLQQEYLEKNKIIKKCMDDIETKETELSRIQTLRSQSIQHQLVECINAEQLITKELEDKRKELIELENDIKPFKEKLDGQENIVRKLEKDYKKLERIYNILFKEE